MFDHRSETWFLWQNEIEKVCGKKENGSRILTEGNLISFTCENCSIYITGAVLGFRKLTQAHRQKTHKSNKMFQFFGQVFRFRLFYCSTSIRIFLPQSWLVFVSKMTMDCPSPLYYLERTDFSCFVQFRLRIYFTLKLLPCSEHVKWERREKGKQMDQLNEHTLEFVVSEENKC